MTFRSDHDAAEVRAKELEAELLRERAATASAIAELESVRAQRVALEATFPAPPDFKDRWYDSAPFTYAMVAFIWISALALVFAIAYFPRVLIAGRW